MSQELKKAFVVLSVISLIVLNILLLVKMLSINADKENIQTSIDTLVNENESLKNQIEEFKNGSQNRLSEIRLIFEKKDYQKVISLADELHEKFTGSSEDLEGQKIKEEASKRMAEEEQVLEAIEANAKAEAEKSLQEKAREIIRITKIKGSKPNSAGGVDLFVAFENNSDKVIKYITFKVTPYNAVGDPVNCEIRRKSTFGAKSTGPYAKGEGLKGDDRYWENAWYSYQIETLQLDKIEIEYMDGTSVILIDKDLEYVQY